MLNFAAYSAYYLALAALPMATTVMSIVMLREHVALDRWFALLLGLAGVVMMVRPGALFDWTACCRCSTALPMRCR